MHLRSLERFPFDSVLLPYNYVRCRDERYAADFEAAGSRLRRARRRSPDDQEHHARALGRPRADSGTWYEPLREQADIDLAVHWVLGRPGVFLNTAGDLACCRKVLDAAKPPPGTPPTKPSTPEPPHGGSWSTLCLTITFRGDASASSAQSEAEGPIEIVTPTPDRNSCALKHVDV